MGDVFSAVSVEIGRVYCKQRGYVAEDVEKSGQEPVGGPKNKKAVNIVRRPPSAAACPRGVCIALGNIRMNFS